MTLPLQGNNQDLNEKYILKIHFFDHSIIYWSF